MAAIPQFQLFPNRRAAGVELARAVRKSQPQPPVIVLALPRGGVPVAYEIAQELQAPLDVIVVRKIGMPGQPELAIGAIASGNTIVREPVVYSSAIGSVAFGLLAQRERKELERRESSYRAGRLPLDLKDKTVVLVDDGIATGASMLAALRAARKAGAKSVVVTAPVASDEATALVGAEADGLVVLKIPAQFLAVGNWYDDFAPVEDFEVCALLERARAIPSRA